MSGKNKKILAFDFDGTLVDSFDVLMQIIFEILKNRGFGVEKEDVSKLYRVKSTKELLEEFNKNKVLNPFLLYYIVFKGRLEYAKKTHEINFHSGIKPFLRRILDDGEIEVRILTSGSARVVSRYLNDNNLGVEIVKSASLFGKGKILKKWKREGNLIYIGDEPRDILASREAGIRSVAVAWGFKTRMVLLDSKPDFFVSNVRELDEVLSKIGYLNKRKSS